MIGTTMDTGMDYPDSQMANSGIEKYEAPVEIEVRQEVEVEVKAEEVKEVQVVEEVQEILVVKEVNEATEVKEILEVKEIQEVQEIKLITKDKDTREERQTSKVVINEHFFTNYGHMADASNDEKLIESRKSNAMIQAEKPNGDCKLCNMF